MNLSDSHNKENNIGILLPRAKAGGGFQLALSIADSLLKYSHKYKYTILYHDKEMLNWLVYLRATSGLVHVKKRTERQRINAFMNLMLNAKVLSMASKEQLENLTNAKMDLLIIPSIDLFGYMNDLPYVITITSILHKCHSMSPVKLSLKDRLHADVICKNASKSSVLSVVDSRMGMDDLSRCYGISCDKMRIVPFIPAGYIYENSDMELGAAEQILAKYALPKKYIFYPARFLHMKNHTFLIRSLRLVEDVFKIRVPVVLVGQQDEAYDGVIRLIKELRMQDQVSHLGYVSDKEIVALYKKAVALVFPCLAGPTNLPPVEAMILGTPVLCSNLFSMPEQVGDAALLFDPFNTEEMAEKIHTIWTDENLRETLKQKGYERIKDLTQENYARQWERVIEDAMEQIQKD